MNSTQTDTSLFDRIRFVLVETSHPGNVGSVARAMKVMGFSNLALVNPRFANVCTHPDAHAFASGATDVLQAALCYSSYAQAVADCQCVVAVSSRRRAFSPAVWTPRSCAAQLGQDLHGTVAIVFGSERYGLPNEIVESAQALLSIPANPDYSSLNLAQAVQIVAYELRMAAEAAHDACAVRQPPLLMPKANVASAHLATAAQVEGMLTHLEHGLIESGFLDPHTPKKLMTRLRRLFSRTQLEEEEIHILRGIARVLEKRGNTQTRA